MEKICEASRDTVIQGNGDARSRPDDVATATFAGFDSDGKFLVFLHDNLQPSEALSTVNLSEGDVGRRIVVAFENGMERKPIIMGRLQDRHQPASNLIYKVDGDRVVLRGERQIELRCGDASIVLTRAGKVLIKGNFVLTRSRGANKIKGAFVDIN